MSVLLNVANVDKSAEAYRNLGCEVETIEMDGVRFATAQIGGGTIVLFPNDSPWLTAEDRAWMQGEVGKGVLVMIETDDVDGMWRRAQRSGFTVDHDLQADRDGSGRGFMLQDPDGYVVGVHEPFQPLPKAKRGAARKGKKRTPARAARKPAKRPARKTAKRKASKGRR